MRNNKGFTLIELLVIMVLLGILLPVMAQFFVQFARNVKRAETQMQTLITQVVAIINSNPAVAPGADQRTFVSTLNQCTLLGGADKGAVQWYAKRQDSRVVGFYKNSATCTAGYIGTLTAQTNPTYDDTETDTFWNVSGQDSTLRIWVHKLNLPH